MTKEVGYQFTTVSLAQEMALFDHWGEVSSFCSRARRFHPKALKVVNKQGRLYVYELGTAIGDVPVGLPHPHASASPKKRVKRDILKASDFSGSATGRLTGRVPDLQVLPVSDQITTPTRDELLEVDMSDIEARVAAFYTDTATRLPQAMKQIEEACRLARLSLLDSFTDAELLAELSKRAKEKGA